MPESFEFTINLPVYPERAYRAWLDSGEHSRFTRFPARIDARPGGQFSSLDGSVTGVLETLTPFDRIVQTWQMADFPSSDSRIELLFEPTCTGSELRLRHSGIPDGKTRQVMQWWEQRYLRPMQRYFDELVGDYVADMGDG